MAKKTLAPLSSISKTYHDSIEIFIGSFGKFFGVSFVPTLISGLLGVAFLGTILGTAVGAANTGGYRQEGLVVGVLVLITVALIQTLGVCALYYMTIHHQKVSVIKSFEQSIGYFFRFVGYGISFFLVSAIGLALGSVVFGLITGLILGFSGAAPEASSLDWLTVIPAIASSALTALIIFTGFIIVDKNVSLVNGLKQSYELVRAYYVPVVVRLALFYTVIGILTFLLTRLPLIGTLLSLLVLTPFTAVYLSVLYQDLAKHNAT